MTSLLYNYFSENNNTDYTFKVLTASKFYQVVNKQLLKKYFAERGVNDIEIKLKGLDEFINQKAFTIAGVCKELQPSTTVTSGELHISNLPIEIINNILPYLEGSTWGITVKTIGNNLVTSEQLNFEKDKKRKISELLTPEEDEGNVEQLAEYEELAIYNENNASGELILNGLASLEYPEAPAG